MLGQVAENELSIKSAGLPKICRAKIYLCKRQIFGSLVLYLELLEQNFQFYEGGKNV